MIAMDKVVKRYKDVIALDHFSFRAGRNEIIGLLGPNGCGKTTAINCMLSLLKFDQGTIELFGDTVSPNNNKIKRRIGIVPQELAIFDKLNVVENIDFYCGLYITNKAERKQLVDEAIEFVGLEKYRKFVPKQLSGGLKRRLNIACGIAHKPEILFLDEPTVAVDAQSRNFILEGVKKMKDRGTTVVYTTHYLEEAEDLCDSFVIMDNGRNVANGTLDELQKSISTTESITVKFISGDDALTERLKQLPHVNQVVKTGDRYNIQFEKHHNNLANLIRFIEDHSLTYTEIASEQPSLSSIFLELTGKELRD
ncbi:ABC transporter ATP-binding protein [Jeotgalicoccus coquinae]|uniref:ABC-2 type transport system ATP-binding protein n=1 Tax=Jeotgalicoccus coquinae TaxID=709509 RepID=A0A6V7RT55_9STAP|nr:ABC transporter ATP-binding protein [Jeotgalicoccus coquinae]MBB6424263.1 ABC-2 type transport system ATP-binding protein [Jeotgalicoccus coquinae]GGE25199.1 ABC transporter ATP-binding protein [Jeotgalicoccus coquinae]CAD2081608.1 Daunorubicin/doxorubicin resistance ATP-binding protein DrrA [Jeotgalicoccus coquinae]